MEPEMIKAQLKIGIDEAIESRKDPEKLEELVDNKQVNASLCA